MEFSGLQESVDALVAYFSAMGQNGGKVVPVFFNVSTLTEAKN